MTKTIILGKADEFPMGASLVEREGFRCVVFRGVDGLRAFSHLCPHLGGPMERVEIDKMVVSCPLHGWQFDLNKGGEEINGYTPLKTFDVEFHGENLCVSSGTTGAGE